MWDWIYEGPSPTVMTVALVVLLFCATYETAIRVLVRRPELSSVKDGASPPVDSGEASTDVALKQPPREGLCLVCAIRHDYDSPHSISAFYRHRFYARHSRQPTWSDAVAHCDKETQELWKTALGYIGYWSEHPHPIAESPAERAENQLEVRLTHYADTDSEWRELEKDLDNGVFDGKD
jgi:hypothetical protein